MTFDTKNFHTGFVNFIITNILSDFISIFSVIGYYCGNQKTKFSKELLNYGTVCSCLTFLVNFIMLFGCGFFEECSTPDFGWLFIFQLVFMMIILGIRYKISLNNI